MELETATRRLSALAQDTRLQIFRQLVKRGPEGLAAGAIARALDIPANTLSAHLLILSNAALVGARREGRSIIYSVKFDAMRDLLVYLTQDCCGGRTEICAPLLEAAACCEPAKSKRAAAPARARRP